MSILYRRFILVASFIAMMGVFAANIILETKRSDNFEAYSPAKDYQCLTGQLCAISKSQAKFVIAQFS